MFYLVFESQNDGCFSHEQIALVFSSVSGEIHSRDDRNRKKLLGLGLNVINKLQGSGLATLLSGSKWKLIKNENKLEFKTITHKQLVTHLKKLNKKKSSGLDGLSQENLLLGACNLIAPLTSIINQRDQ